MRPTTMPAVAGEMNVYASPERYPGLRVYEHLSTQGYVLTRTTARGAVVLWNPDGSDSAPYDDAASRAALTQRWRSEILPSGTMAAHTKRAETIARALDDGAFLAIEALLRAGLLRGTQSEALRASPLSYARLRDYLAYDENLPWLVACAVALRFTAFSLNTYPDTYT